MEDKEEKCAKCPDRDSCQLRAREEYFKAHEAEFVSFYEDIKPAVKEILEIVANFYELFPKLAIEHITTGKCCLTSALGQAIKLGFYKGRTSCSIPDPFKKAFKEE